MTHICTAESVVFQCYPVFKETNLCGSTHIICFTLEKNIVSSLGTCLLPREDPKVACYQERVPEKFQYYYGIIIKALDP